jgi:steroid 5-alpha reductase family enzyme
MMMGVTELLLGNFAALLAIILLLWAISVAIRDVSFIDAFWAFGMVILAWFSWARTETETPRGWLILALVTLWGLRLSLHLFVRWRAHGEDPRYKRIIGSAMEKNGWSWARTSLLMVFLLQLPLLFVTCLPAQMGIWVSGGHIDSFGALAVVGAVIALIGIAFETIGDAQLNAFRANPDNKGKVLDTGLWRYTRHPNYFGDACTWWGIWLVAADSGHVAAYASIIGPIFLTFTLTRWSGAALLEKGLKKTRPDYAAYVARTSGFLPWPPKRG